MPATVMIRDIRAQLKRDEGYRTTVYEDSRGILTVGVGHSLKVPLTYSVIEQILTDDLHVAEEAVERLGWWTRELSEPRRGVLVNMAFNLGPAGLGGFRKMLAALQAGQYDEAAAEMLDSLWATQVGDRAQRLAIQMRTDQWV